MFSVIRIIITGGAGGGMVEVFVPCISSQPNERSLWMSDK